MQKRATFLFLILIVTFLTFSVNAYNTMLAIIPVSSSSSDSNQATGPLTISGLPFVEPGQIVNFKIKLDNLAAMTHTLQLTNSLPFEAQFISGTASPGMVYDSGLHHLTWSGSIGPGEPGYAVTAVSTPTYINLGTLPTPPTNLCDLITDCDEGTAVINLATTGHTASFFGESVATFYLSANGLIYGAEGITGAVCLACPQPLPHAAEPNQLIAGLWRDIDMDGGNGEWYAAIITGLLDNPADEVLYVNWHNAGHFGNPFLTTRHAIAIVLDGQSEPAGRIYVIIDHISNADKLTQVGFSIGVENREGNIGLMHAFSSCLESPCIPHNAVGSVPADGTTLRFDPAVVSGPNGRTFTYQAQIKGDVGTLFSNTVTVSSTGFFGEETAVSQTFIDYRRYLPIVGR